MKLERVLKSKGNWGRREVRLRLSRGEVRVDGAVVRDGQLLLSPFATVECGDQVLSQKTPRYLMLHKPLGVVSATVDEEHETVIDLIAEPWAGELHLAGRLDRFTSGLVVLTNDGRFSEALTRPEQKVGKVYHVCCDGPLLAEMRETLQQGMWLAKEGVTTQPAQVESLSDYEHRLTIYEGKHHQVKRMFAHFGLKVVALHREAMGPLRLDGSLALGHWRFLTEDELSAVFKLIINSGREFAKTGEVGL